MPYANPADQNDCRYRSRLRKVLRGLCFYCPTPRAPGDVLFCVRHRAAERVRRQRRTERERGFR